MSAYEDDDINEGVEDLGGRPIESNYEGQWALEENTKCILHFHEENTDKEGDTHETGWWYLKDKPGLEENPNFTGIPSCFHCNAEPPGEMVTMSRMWRLNNG